MVYYLDTSAFLKLLTVEDGSEELRAWLGTHGPIWSSQLLHTEALRAGVRLGIATEAIEAALETVSTVLPSAATFYVAGRLHPLTLRSLDALHLATALEIGGDLEAMVVYDDRLIAAARAASIDVVTPR
jgi:predicted nucleic acid-binding protein